MTNIMMPSKNTSNRKMPYPTLDRKATWLSAPIPILMGCGNNSSASVKLSPIKGEVLPSSKNLVEFAISTGETIGHVVIPETQIGDLIKLPFQSFDEHIVLWTRSISDANFIYQRFEVELMIKSKSRSKRKLAKLSDLVPLLRELAHDVVNRNFEKLIERSQIEIEHGQTEADNLQYFIDSLDSYPFKPIDPPDTEIYRAIGVFGEQIRDQMENEIPMYGDDYEEYTKEDRLFRILYAKAKETSSLIQNNHIILAGQCLALYGFGRVVICVF